MYFNQAKGLIGALAISGFLNIILLTSIFYSQMKERPPALYCEQKPALKLSKQPPLSADESSSHLILRLQALPYEQLIGKLKSLAPLENGHTERDLALACLVACHYFDLPRALEGSASLLQERLVTYQQPNGSNSSIKIYSALSNAQFAAITAFATNERWPQTPKGLFLLLQKKKENYDSTLLDAFFLTSEFMALEALFKRTETPLNKMEIVNFLIEGDWTLLSQIFEQQRLYGNISDLRRQQVLLDYAQKGSTAAANLLSKTDASISKTPVPVVSVPVVSVPVVSPPVVAAPVKVSKRPTQILPKSDRLYIVQDGDTLWKLSQRFNIEIIDLKRYNKLTSDALTPNSALRIPEAGR